MDIAENPSDPQLHAPALAPIMDPIKPVPDFLKLLLFMRIRYMLKLATIPDNDEIAIISTKSTIACDGTWNTKTGEMKINSETMDKKKNNPANMAMDE